MAGNYEDIEQTTRRRHNDNYMNTMVTPLSKTKWTSTRHVFSSFALSRCTTIYTRKNTKGESEKALNALYRYILRPFCFHSSNYSLNLTLQQNNSTSDHSTFLSFLIYLQLKYKVGEW